MIRRPPSSTLFPYPALFRSSGALTITDVDQGQANFTAQPSTAGSNGYGAFTLDAAGNWTYSANDSQTAIQQLGAIRRAHDCTPVTLYSRMPTPPCNKTINGT